ncbi:MAG: DUF1203 domain-containing protein [Myxococcota bacterium]
MRLFIRGIPTDEFERLRAGGPDAHGLPPLLRRAEGAANPCRHCLDLIRQGEPKLVLAHRPFPRPQPYAECGPIFLHATPCRRYEREALPEWFVFLEPAIVRGYDADDWILYETGRVVPGRALEGACHAILDDPRVAYVHVRSKFNCFQCRVDREQEPSRASSPERGSGR